MKISESFGVDLLTVQKFRKELDESKSDYEGTAAWKLHFDSSVKKRALEFVGMIQAIIDNNPYILWSP